MTKMDLDWIRASLRVSPNQPRFLQSVIQFLEALPLSEMSVLETGSGLSTIWLGQRVLLLDSWEHLPDFAYAVQERLVEEQMYNVELHFATNYSYNQFQHLDKRYDLVIIDGDDNPGCRVATMLACHYYVKSEGWLIIDDSEREVYGEGLRYLDSMGWAMVEHEGVDPYARPGKCRIYRSSTRPCIKNN